jgi:hypothetical protein
MTAQQRPSVPEDVQHLIDQGRISYVMFMGQRAAALHEVMRKLDLQQGQKVDIETIVQMMNATASIRTIPDKGRVGLSVNA